MRRTPQATPPWRSKANDCLALEPSRSSTPARPAQAHQTQTHQDSRSRLGDRKIRLEA